MTQEEKAKAYDEALERARKIHSEIVNNEIIGFPGQIEGIFPQLRESEDERIRGRLIQVVSAIAGGWPFEAYGITKKEALAYLEKQKEYKPTSFNEPYNPDDYEVVMEGNATSLKRKEQKPIEDVVKDITKNKESAIKFLKSAGIMDDNGELAEIYRSEQKPAEWSEEDETIRNNILSVLSCFVGTSECESNPSLSTSYPLYQREKDWLKSLRPSWKPSEQEKGALRTAISILTEERNFPKAAAHLQAILDAFDGKESRSSWKPSEEDKEMKLKILKYLSTRCSVEQFEEVEEWLNNKLK